MGKLTIQPTSIGQGKEALMHNGDGLDESKWRELAGHLEKDATLKILTLEYSYTLTESEEILAALRVNRSLECVTLKDSSIGNSLAKVIDALSENKKLNHLLLCVLQEKKGEIDDAFMSSLASLITSNSGLQHLNLENISITNEKFSLICQAVATTPYLTELVLINIKLSSKNRQQLIDALQANSRIKVSMSGCDKELEIALKYNSNSNRNRPTLSQSVKDGNLEQVKSILQSANCTEAELLVENNMGETPLYVATRLADVQMMTAIVTSPLCTEQVLLKSSGLTRDTVLHQAVRTALMHRNLNIMVPIMGAEQRSENVLAAQNPSGNTALHLAMIIAPEEIPMGKSDFNPLNVIGMILPSCTEKVLEIQNIERKTPLHLAAEFAILCGYTDILESILSLESCTKRVLDVRNGKGETVLDMARASKKDNIINLILSKSNSESNIVTNPSTTSLNRPQPPQPKISQAGDIAFFGDDAPSTQQAYAKVQSREFT